MHKIFQNVKDIIKEKGERRIQFNFMKSFWMEESKNHTEYEKVNENIKTEVCVIGGGLTGLNTAYYLSKYKKIVLLEKDRICSKTSGANTGKVTFQHGLFYDYLIMSQGKEYAKDYLDANKKSIDNIERIVTEENIKCDFERDNAYVFTTKNTELYKIKEEQKAVKKLDKELSRIVQNIDLPIKIEGAIEFKNQAKIHPVKYSYGLADAIIRNNGKIYENSKVIDVKKNEDKYDIYVNNNIIKADYVVIATRYPFIKIPGYFFLKMYQSTSYAILVDTKCELPDGMYISEESPVVSYRSVKDVDNKYLLAVGYDYKTGTETLEDGYKRLEMHVKKMYPESNILYKWSAEDCITLDKIPYIGELSKMMPNIYVGTGFNKWGITSSNIAASIICDKILGKENKYEEIFKSARVKPIKNRVEVGNMIKEASESIVFKKFKISKSELEDVKVGEGKIIEFKNEKIGVYKKTEDEIFMIKPICTHLGCELYFNNVDKTWECPCHGSKFSYEGKQIEGPSNKDLKRL